MPSTDEFDRPDETVAVARRYLRYERPANALVVTLAVATFLGAYLTTSLLPAVVVAGLLVLVARAPVFESHGTMRLTSDAPPSAVVDEFAGPTPPVLAFQWGVANAVRTDESGRVEYPVSYLFGLRSAVAGVDRETTVTDAGHRVELTVDVDGSPWATYTAMITAADRGSHIEVQYESNRRFGLRRVPQQRLAARFRDEALETQGYRVVSRDSHFGL
jgi:hypothetical protein